MYGFARTIKEQPEKAQELMNFLGAASMVECQVYPVNSKYHMNLVGVPMTLQSRRQDYKLLTGSKKLEIEEFCAITETFRKSFFWKVIRDNCRNGGDLRPAERYFLRFVIGVTNIRRKRKQKHIVCKNQEDERMKKRLMAAVLSTAMAATMLLTGSISVQAADAAAAGTFPQHGKLARASATSCAPMTR